MSLNLPLLRGVTLAIFLLLCASLPLAGFRALRPRRGTTDWMRRLDPPQRRPAVALPLRRVDALLAPLAALGAALLWLLPLFLRGGWLLPDAPWGFLRPLLRDGLPLLLAAAALGLGVYLLVRACCAQGGVALCAALLSPLLLWEHAASGAALSLSLWCLRQWMTAPAQAVWPRRAVWLVPAALLYALTLALCWPCLLLSPLLLVAWLSTLLRRWRHDGHRTGRLFLALGLSALLTLLAATCAWVLHGILDGSLSDWGALRSAAFYAELWSALSARLRALFSLSGLRGELRYARCFPLLLGLAALPLLLHGLLRQRDERCLHALLLLLGLLAVWLLGGVWLLPLGLLLCYAWCWELCAARRSYSAVWGTALGLALFPLTDILWTLWLTA